MVTLVNDSNIQEAINANSVVVVKYFADWCGSCRLFAPKYKRLSDDARFEGYTFLEVDSEHNPEARALAGGVSNLPFFAVFKDGKVIAGDCTTKEEYLVSLLEQGK